MHACMHVVFMEMMGISIMRTYDNNIYSEHNYKECFTFANDVNFHPKCYLITSPLIPKDYPRTCNLPQLCSNVHTFYSQSMLSMSLKMNDWCLP